MSKANQQINKTLFENKMEENIKDMKHTIENTMVENGLKCSQSQKICLLQAINDLEHNINGVELNDFKN